MGRRVEYRAAGAKDVAEAVAGLRPEDVWELAMYEGLDVGRVVEMSVAASEVCEAVRVDGRLVALMGVRVESVIGAEAVIWAVATEAAREYPVTFLRRCKEAVGRLMRAVPAEVYVNWVWEGNVMHLNWLHWLGAHISSEVAPGALGGVYRKFYLEPEMEPSVAEGGQEDV